MKYSAIALLAMCGKYVVAAEAANKMERLMSLKLEQRDKMVVEGAFAPGKYEKVSTLTKCTNGKAGEYACSGVDLAAFLPHEAMGSTTREGNDVWGECCGIRDDTQSLTVL